MRNADECWTGVGVEKMNSVILIGNLASDVETREVGDGRRVATFRLAVQRRFVNQQGEREADFFPSWYGGKRRTPARGICARGAKRRWRDGCRRDPIRRRTGASGM